MARRLVDIPCRCKTTCRPIARQSSGHSVQRPSAEPATDAGFFEGLRAEDLPDARAGDGDGAALTHNGTHLDAPYHYHPTMNRGERSWTIDEVPLEWCLQPASSWTSPFSRWLCRDCPGCETELERIGHTLSPLEMSWSIPAPAPDTAPGLCQFRLRHGL